MVEELKNKQKGFYIFMKLIKRMVIMYKLKIKGMNCAHCVAAVKKAIENVGGVKNVRVSLEKNEAEIEADKNLDIEVVKKAVYDSGNFSAEE